MLISLKNRITLAVVLVTMVLLAGAVWFSSTLISRQAQTIVESQVSSRLQVTVTAIDNRLHTSRRFLRLLSDGLTKEKLRSPGEIQAYLDRQVGGSLMYDNGILYFSPSGRLVAVHPYQPDVVGMDFSFREYFQDTVNHGKAVLSEPFTSKQLHQHPIVMLTEPIYDAAGDLVGVLAGSLDLHGRNFFDAMFRSETIGEGNIFLLDRDGRYLYHPDPDMILKASSDLIPQATFRHVQLAKSEPLDSAELNSDHLFTFLQVPGTDWVAVAVTPMAAVVTQGAALRSLLVASLVLLGGLTALAVRLAVSRLAQPLVALSEKLAAHTARGEPFLPPNKSEFKELHQLSRSIQLLVEKVNWQQRTNLDHVAFLQNFIDTVPNPLFHKDSEFRFVNCNRPFEKYIGLQREVLAGRTVYDIAPEGLAEVYDRADRDVWESGGEISFETVIKFADGTLRDVIFYEKVFRDSSGQPSGIVGTFLDITELKCSERALRQSEKYFRLLVDSAADAFFLHDSKGHILDVNRQAVTSLGYSREELLSMRVSDISVNFNPSRLEDLQSRLARGMSETIDDLHRRKDGHILPVEVRVCRVEQEGGLTIALARDVSERKQNEESLKIALEKAQSAREQVTNILRSVADGLIVTDEQHRVIHMNEVAEKLIGTSIDEVVGQPFTRLFQDENLRRQAREFLSQPQSDQRRHDFQIVDQEDGIPQVIQASTAIMRSHSGDEIGLVTILRDVTRERELDRIKNEFISTAAHEMRTPMAVILGYSELLTDPEFRLGIDSDQQDDCLREIHRKSESLSRIVDDLFDISRIETGQPLPMEKSRCDLGVLLNEVVDRYCQHSPKHRFEVDIDSGLVIYADSGKLSQVFENLVSNAVKYSPQGGEVRVSCRIDAAVVRIAVRDHGIGMTPEQQKRIFDKFYRADSSDTAIGGLGLGMSIAKAIIDNHQGTIAVESQPGHGTTIHVTLPLGIETDGPM